MSITSPAAILARLLRSEPDAVLRLFSEAVEALVGKKVGVEAVDAEGSDLEILFGNRALYLFPFEDHQGGALRMFIALDLPAAVCTGGAFSLMGPEQIKEVLGTGEIPEILHDSIGEVANIIVGSVGKIIRMRAPSGTPEFRRGTEFQKMDAGAWPAVVQGIDGKVPWDVIGGRITIDGEDTGAVLIGAADGKRGKLVFEGAEVSGEADDDEDGDGAPGGASTPRPAMTYETVGGEGGEAEGARLQLPPGLKVQVTGNPSDRAMNALRALFEESGAQVLPVHGGGGPSHQPSALLVVSRSPIDLKARLDAVSSASRRPPLVVACSDRPTHELVRAARAGGADDFVVLPASTGRLTRLFARFAEAMA